MVVRNMGNRWDKEARDNLVRDGVILALALMAGWAVYTMVGYTVCFSGTDQRGTRSEAESAQVMEVSEDTVLRQEHRPHEVEAVEAGKRDSMGNLIDPAPQLTSLKCAVLTSALDAGDTETVENPDTGEEYYEEPAYVEYYGDDYGASYSPGAGYYVDDNGVVHAEYNESYNSDGPTREMPGWHDGYLETYYNASAHEYASTWTLDDEGFYHDSEGRYVVGVDINHRDDMPYGTVVQTGKGEGVVYDYGAGWEVHDFATIW